MAYLLLHMLIFTIPHIFFLPIDRVDLSGSRESSDASRKGPSTRALKSDHCHCRSWRSVLTLGDANRLRIAYAIPEIVVIRIPRPEVGAELDDKRHEVCVYESMFMAGVRLPFIPVI